MKECARRLLAYEGGSPKSRAKNGPAAFAVCERLRAPLGSLMGGAGFRALFSRALALAATDVSWLRALHVRADGSLEGFQDLDQKLEANELALGEIALVSQLLGLLVTFIGPALTLQLLRETWPKHDLCEFEFES